MQIRSTFNADKDTINDVVSIHLNTFQGFFLTFMGRRFLKLMYRSYVEYDNSGVLVAFDDYDKPIGFLAYSGDLNGLYKYMIKKRLIPFAMCSVGAFFRKPAIFMRLLRAFLKPSESKREEKYIELASIGVDPNIKLMGVGSRLIAALKSKIDFDHYAYITLETDAVNNEGANRFYQKNGFIIEREFETNEGRRMFEYRFYKRPEETENEENIIY